MAGAITPLYDTELENIRSQLAYADALRKKSMETGGQMVGRHYVAKNPWENFFEGLSGGVVNRYQRDKQSGLERQMEQGRQDWLGAMPAEEEIQQVEQMGPVRPDEAQPTVPQMLPKAAKKYAQEMQQWGMKAPRGMESVQQFALQQAMTAPQREAERKEAAAAREHELQLRLQEARERAARDAESRQDNLDIKRGMLEVARGGLRVKEEAAQGKRDEADTKANEAATHAQGQLDILDIMIGKRDPVTGQLLKDSAPHKGFQNYVGATWLPGARYIEGTDAAGYEALHKQVTSEARLQGVQMMKGAGAVSNAEGEAAAKALTSMSKSQSEKDYVEAALRYRKVLERAADRVKRGVKVDPITGKEYPAGGAAPAGAAPATGGVKVAPPAAIEKLRANPALAPAFMEKYGYLP